MGEDEKKYMRKRFVGRVFFIIVLKSLMVGLR